VIFRRTTYLYAVEWENYFACWQSHRTHWMDIDMASAKAEGLRNAHPDRNIRNIKIIRRPVGRVEVWL
jgi:hypothetical protein